MTVVDSKNGRLKSASTLNQIDDEDDDSNHEQEVDQAAANVAEEAKKPEHYQDDNYSQNIGNPFELRLRFR